jgi:alkyldihydroxyacetonephosphate synthase
MERTKLRWNGWGPRPDALAERGEVWTWLAAELGMPALLATPSRALEDIALAPPRLSAGQHAALVDILGEGQVRQDAKERISHALGRSYQNLLRLRGGDIAITPDAVLYPRNTGEVLALLRHASESGIAVIPYGGGTSPDGGVDGARGECAALVSIDLSEMDRFLDIDTMAGTAIAEAGIGGPGLEKNLALRGFTLGHRPDSFEFSTLGGWIAEDGAGQDANHYGRARDWLAGVSLATPTGLLNLTEFPAPDLKTLVAGSRGGLGVVTQATIRVRPIAAGSEYQAWLFGDFAAGIVALHAAARARIPNLMLRLSDAGDTRFRRNLPRVEKWRGLKDRLRDRYLGLRRMNGQAALLTAGFSGSEKDISAARDNFAVIAKRLGALSLGEEQRWQEERFAAPELRDSLMERGVGVERLEAATSWSKLPALYAATRRALVGAMRRHVPCPGAHGLVLCHVSRSGMDGASLVFTCIFPRTLNDEMAQAHAIRQAGLDVIHAQGCTMPMDGLERELLLGIKKILDPRGIMNPGKLP